MSDVEVEGFLHDLVFELIEQTRNPLVKEKSDYQRGYQFGLYVVLERIKHQAETFGVDMDQIGFGDFDAEKWFMSQA